MSKNCPPLLACPQFFFMLLRCKSANLGVIRTCAERLFVGASWSKKGRIHMDMSQYHAIPCMFFRMLHTRCHYITNPNNAPLKGKSLKMTIYLHQVSKTPPNKWVFQTTPWEHTLQLKLSEKNRASVCLPLLNF